jgi:hypothetical protein
MPNIRSIDMMLLDDLFDMGGGYVLNFSDRTFAQFFAEELNVDIDNLIYARNGGSKAKRLRCYLQTVDVPAVVQALSALWEYRQAVMHKSGREDTVQNAQGRFLDLVNRIQGKATTVAAGAPPVTAFDRHVCLALRAELVQLASLSPQARGYAFESFLKKLFDAHGLAAQEPFRLQGEQVDGSFQLSGQTYLIEAKWQNLPSGVADLHVFHGKVEQKAAWTRGLFISNSGFTEDGLVAFGRGKRVICMDGYDLYETLNRELPLKDVLERKVRRAAETGSPFSRVRDLF